MTVQEWQAKTIERSGEALAVWIETTPDDKLGWTPELPGCAGLRSIHQQMDEVCGVNLSIAAALRGEQRKPNGESTDKEKIQSKAQAVAELRNSVAAISTAIRGMPDSAFNQKFDMGFAQVPGAVLLELANNNMLYHGGQINYVQMLCGDKEFHFPESFFAL